MPYDIIIGRDESDKKNFGKKGLIKLGKGYVRMGQYTSMSNNIFMDVARSHVILIAGKRGSGKSYTLGTIAEEISSLNEEERENIAPLIFDTMGIFWTMKYENEKEKSLLNEWGLKPKKLPVKVFAPYGYFDYYVEELKDPIKNSSKEILTVLEETFKSCLLLLHPFMPFVTEAIWQEFNGQASSILNERLNKNIV